MKDDIKTEWVARLRNQREKKYKQGKNVLKQAVSYSDTPEFCCLGVLCDMAEEAGVVSSQPDLDDEENTPWEYGNEQGSSVETLPKAVREWAGIPDGNPMVFFEDGISSLADLNDSGHSFEEIADVIEKQL